MIDPKLWKLPSTLQFAGDPVDDNPFPKHMRQHEAWAVATRAAEQEICRIDERIAGRSESEIYDKPQLLFETPIEKFDVWALRGIQVVWSDGDAAQYSAWLLNYANAWIESFAKTQLGLIPSVMDYVKMALIARVSFWKGESRKHVAAIEEAHKPRQEAIDAGWLRIETQRLGGATLTSCLHAAYDHHVALLTCPQTSYQP